MKSELLKKNITDFNENALRGWIFATATSVVKKEEEKKRIKKEKKISGEAL